MRPLIICLLFPFYLFGQFSSSIGAGFSLTDLGGNKGKGTYGVKDIDFPSIQPYVTFSYHLSNYRFSFSFIRLEGADSLAPSEGHSYNRFIRGKYFINDVIELGVLREFSIVGKYNKKYFGDILLGVSGFYHKFKPKFQPALLTGFSIPLLDKEIKIRFEFIYRTTFTDKIDNYHDEEYSKGFDGFGTVGFLISYKGKKKYLSCPKVKL